jgi:hypothetical protein
MVAPIVNAYIAKHAHEESECAKPKDWKEWGLFAWCMDPKRMTLEGATPFAIRTANLMRRAKQQ